MKKLIWGTILLAGLTLSNAANSIPVALQAYKTITASGTVVSWIFDGSNATSASGMVVGATASTATWDWDAANQLLTSTGYLQLTAHIGNNPVAGSVVSYVVQDLVIDAIAGTTDALSFECREGNFLAGVGVHGCANVIFGDNYAYESAVVYNVGGNAHCINRTVGGDDISVGAPLGLSTLGASCDPVQGVFDLYQFTVGSVILSNGICMEEGNSACAGATWMTLEAVPIPAAAWLLGSALGLLGWIRRKTAV